MKASPLFQRIRRSSFGFPLFFAAVFLVSWTVLRVILWKEYHPDTIPPGEALRTFLAGLHIDLAMSLTASALLIGLCWFLAAVVSIPAGLAGVLAGKSWFTRWHRWAFRGFMGFFCVLSVFLLISEWYFFDEFTSRFNTVAIDYLIYPQEVFTNIRESYPVPAILAVCLAGGLSVCWLAFRYFSLEPRLAPTRDPADPPANPVTPLKKSFPRFRSTAIWVVVSFAGVLTIRSRETSFSRERIINELANNGWASAARAGWTRDLDFTAFYSTLPPLDAVTRTRRLLAGPGITFAGPEVSEVPMMTPEGNFDTSRNQEWLRAVKRSLTKEIAGDPAKPKLNVCILLEESLGSEFWGCLGRKKKNGNPDTLTPHMDKLAATDGMLFTQIFADGNRTIRGFEGVFSSIPPLPGDSILARDKTENVETIARVLRRDGYETLFLYGGHGTFDNIASYTTRNGWNRLIQQSEYINPVHTTAWGVCDEDLYHRGIEEMRSLHAAGKPFLVSFMTVSNHLPFTFPTGRIKEDPNTGSRKSAVKYADWALGDFFERVQKEPYWNDTIFVVVADHGARVYGHETIPMRSYQIPVLVAGPSVVPAPSRVDVTGCQLDVSPTILSLIGRPYTSLFFGHDLLEETATSRSRCLMHHNRSIAIYRDGVQVVYNLNKELEFRQGDPQTDTLLPMENPTETAMELSRDGSALFQTANLLYDNRLFRLDADGPAN